MFGDIREFLTELLFTLPAVVVALTVHEFSHAFVSSKLGDPLPGAKGRLSLNPLRHIDPIGMLMLIFFRFGWAKPVHVDPRYYKRPKLYMALTALAGPVSNLIAAFVLSFFLVLALKLMPAGAGTLWTVIYTLLLMAVLINIGLAVFNLIPISPLDGSKVFLAFLPLKYYEKVLKYERYGFIILILFLVGVPSRLLGIFGVPASVTVWFDLTTYLGAVRGFIFDAFTSLFGAILL